MPGSMRDDPLCAAEAALRARAARGHAVPGGDLHAGRCGRAPDPPEADGAAAELLLGALARLRSQQCALAEAIDLQSSLAAPVDAGGQRPAGSRGGQRPAEPPAAVRRGGPHRDLEAFFAVADAPPAGTLGALAAALRLPEKDALARLVAMRGAVRACALRVAEDGLRRPADQRAPPPSGKAAASSDGAARRLQAAQRSGTERLQRLLDDAGGVAPEHCRAFAASVREADVWSARVACLNALVATVDAAALRALAGDAALLRTLAQWIASAEADGQPRTLHSALRALQRLGPAALSSAPVAGAVASLRRHGAPYVAQLASQLVLAGDAASVMAAGVPTAPAALAPHAEHELTAAQAEAYGAAAAEVAAAVADYSQRAQQLLRARRLAELRVAEAAAAVAQRVQSMPSPAWRGPPPAAAGLQPTYGRPPTHVEAEWEGDGHGGDGVDGDDGPAGEPRTCCKSWSQSRGLCPTAPCPACRSAGRPPAAVPFFSTSRRERHPQRVWLWAAGVRLPGHVPPAGARCTPSPKRARRG